MSTRNEEERLSRVFVYGTLRGKKAATHVLPRAALWLIKNGNFPYPTVRFNDEGAPYSEVVGNLLLVDDAQLAELDAYEGVEQGLYRRQEVVVQEIGNADANVSTYIYVGSDNFFPSPIPSGDWFNR